MANKQEPLPKYVLIYNQLLTAIDTGEFKAGTKLPPEETLAKYFNVSRMTLRQALSLLREDGKVMSRKGSGTIVSEKRSSPILGIEHSENPIQAICQKKITTTNFSMGLSYSNPYTRELFGRNSPAGVHFDRIYLAEKERVAYSYALMLIDTAEKFKLDLEDKEQMQKFIDHDIYKLTLHRQLTFKIGIGTESVQKQQLSSISNQYLIVFESLFDQQEKLLVFTKHYIPVELVNMTLNLPVT